MSNSTTPNTKQYILKVHTGLDHDAVSYVESTLLLNGQLEVLLVDDVHEARYDDLRSARDWAKQIVDSKGRSTWRIEVIPLEDEL